MILLSDHIAIAVIIIQGFIATIVLYEYFGKLHRSKIRARSDKTNEPSEAIKEVKRNPLEETLRNCLTSLFIIWHPLSLNFEVFLSKPSGPPKKNIITIDFS
jgi:hypothetical protein